MRLIDDKLVLIIIVSDQLFQVLSRRLRENHANKCKKRKSEGEISCLLSIGLTKS